jgi:hypothetical protein
MEQENFIFQLTKGQFFFLTQMMEIHNVAGFEDPYRGFLIEELEEEYEVIKKQLLDLGYLKIDSGSDSGLIIDDALGICIAACGAEDVIHAKKDIRGGEHYDAFLYFLPQIVVERTSDEENEVILCPVANAELSMNVLLGFFPLQLQSERDCWVNLIEMDWNRWNQLNQEQQIHKLVSSGCDDEVAPIIVATFHNGQKNGSVVYWRKVGSSWYQEAYHYAHDNNEMYLVTEPDDNVLRIEAYQPQIFLDSLLRFAEQFDIVLEGA